MHLENVGYVPVLTITNGILPTASTLDVCSGLSAVSCLFHLLALL